MARHRDKLDSIKDSIVATASPRKRLTIEALWDLLCEMQDSGNRTFTIAVVGRACEKVGFLKTQTIRNQTGAEYRKLIEAFQGAINAEQTSVHFQRKGWKPGSDPIGDFVAKLDDLDMRTRIGILVSEHAKQRDEINRLKAAFKHITSPLPSRSIGDTPTSAARPKVSLAVLRPIQKFLSEDWLSERDLTLDDAGTIYNGKGERLTPIGFAKSLRTVIDALSEKSS